MVGVTKPPYVTRSINIIDRFVTENGHQNMAKLFFTDPECGNCAHGPDATTQPTNGF